MVSYSSLLGLTLGCVHHIGLQLESKKNLTYEQNVHQRSSAFFKTKTKDPFESRLSSMEK